MSMSFSLKLSLDEPACRNQFTVRRDDGPDLRFDGEILAGVSNRWDGEHRQDPWIELKLYKTRGGQYVCERIDMSQRDPDSIRRAAQVVDSPHSVMGFFGYGELAHELYVSAGLVSVENVE
ncbi:MAG: hypothetical protein ACPG4N_05025 [Gammaproteobacteria bacterium]